MYRNQHLVQYPVNHEEDMNEDYGYFYILDADTIPRKPIIRMRHKDYIVVQTSDITALYPRNPTLYPRNPPIKQPVYEPPTIGSTSALLLSYNPLYAIAYTVFKWLFEF